MIRADRWEVLEKVGSYVAGELSGEEARETERFVREGGAEGRRLAESYARMLDLLSATGGEPLEPPEGVLDRIIRRVTGEV